MRRGEDQTVLVRAQAREKSSAPLLPRMCSRTVAHHATATEPPQLRPAAQSRRRTRRDRCGRSRCRRSGWGRLLLSLRGTSAAIPFRYQLTSMARPNRVALVVEDDADARRAMEWMLDLGGYVPVGVGTAMEALTYLLS